MSISQSFIFPARGYLLSTRPNRFSPLRLLPPEGSHQNAVPHYRGASLRSAGGGVCVVQSARRGDVRAEEADVPNVNAVPVELRCKLHLTVSRSERETAAGEGLVDCWLQGGKGSVTVRFPNNFRYREST